MSQSRIAILDMPIPQAPSAVAQYRGVDFNGAQITVAGAAVYGIAKQPAAIGEPFEIAVLGTAVCEAGAAVAKGVPVAMDATGRVVLATNVTVAVGATAMTGAVANGVGSIVGGNLPQYIVGYTLEAATAAGQFVEVLLSR